jgi:signal transduction histidine kinase
LIPGLLYFIVLAYLGFSGASLPRQLASLPVIFWFLALGSVAWWAGSREHGAGHRIVAVTLWGVPALTVTVALVQLDSVLPRYYVFPPLIVMGLMMIPVSLLRRRRALEAEVALRGAAETELARLNASLERAVAERTADLQNLVAGLESFNRSVSHDLRGSLGGIGGLARLAHASLAQGDAALARRALPLIAEQAEKSQQLMGTLLSLAKVSDAKLQCEPVDLWDLVDHVLQQIALERGDTPLPQIVLAPDMPSVHADPELLKPVFANLIGNAIKFSRDAQAPRIDIGARPSAGEEGSGVTVEVRDNGVGFDPQAATSLFSPFVRLSEQKFDGHGIGLSIVRRAVERHGGRVWAESHPGEGAIFRFSLPS